MDIIVFNPEIFYSFKEDSYTTNPILEKILLLDCFDEHIALTKYNNLFKANTNKYANTSSKRYRKKYNNFDNNRPNFEKELTTCINLINASNKSKIINRIINIVDYNDNKLDCLSLILDKACRHEIYLDIILCVFDKIPQDLRYISFNKFYNTFIQNIDRIITELNTIDYNNPDQFCTFCLIKKNFLTRHKCIMLFDLCFENIETYYLTLISFLENDEIKPYVVDILINLLINITDYYPIFVDHFKKKCNDINIYSYCNQKTKFSLEKIIPMIRVDS